MDNYISAINKQYVNTVEYTYWSNSMFVISTYAPPSPHMIKYAAPPIWNTRFESNIVETL